VDNFELEIKTAFLEEATQLLADAEQCFLNLEVSRGDPSILDQIFRLAHNLKGSAKAVGFDELSDLTHHLESLMLEIKNKKLLIDPHTIDLLLRCNDHIRMMIAELKLDLRAHFDSNFLLSEIEELMKSSVRETPNDFALNVNTLVDKARVVQALDIKNQKHAPTTASEDSIRVSFLRVEKLLNLVGEMVILQTLLKEQAFQEEMPHFRRGMDQLGKVTKEVQNISMSLRMIPLKQAFLKMQRIIRDTAKTLEKKVNLEMRGEDTEVDKTLFERLSDPLIHLVRNAVDHGIESPETRIKAGKPEMGTIILSAAHHTGYLHIEIRDDGCGLDTARLQKIAIERGILKSGTILNDREAQRLIFASGFSTKTEVTDISGRGVGMDVVKANIEQLQGEIQIESVIGKGSCFRLILPLTLAIIDGLLVRCSSQRYVIPLTQILESVQIGSHNVKFATGLGEILLLRGENIPLYSLSSLLQLPNDKKIKKDNEGVAVVIKTQKKSFALRVDEIIGQQQVVIKALGKELKNVKGFSGSAILGDGCPTLILEPQEIVQKYNTQSIATEAERMVS